MLEGGGRKAQYAGALLYGLGYPRFSQNLSDTKFAVELIGNIAEARQTDLLSDTAQQCGGCSQVNNCEIGALIVAGPVQACGG